jgi:hypothetical protein
MSGSHSFFELQLFPASQVDTTKYAAVDSVLLPACAAERKDVQPLEFSGGLLSSTQVALL